MLHLNECMKKKSIYNLHIKIRTVILVALPTRGEVLNPLTKLMTFLYIYMYRGSPLSTVSLSTVPGLVRFSNSTK